MILSNPYPFLIAMLCAVSNGFFLLSYSWFANKDLVKNFRLPKKGWKDLIVFGAFVHCFSLCFFSVAIQYISPIKMCFMFAMSPFVTMILEYFFSEEILTSKKILGLLIGLCGLIPVLLDSNHGAYKDIPFRLELFGEFMTLMSILQFSYGWIVMKRFLKNNFCSSIEIVNGIAMLIGGLSSFVLFSIIYQRNIFHVSLTAEFPFLLAAFILLNLVAYVIYPYLLKVYSVTFITFAGFLEPTFGLLFGLIFLGNKITLLSCVALIFLVSGLYLYYKEETRIY